MGILDNECPVCKDMIGNPCEQCRQKMPSNFGVYPLCRHGVVSAIPCGVCEKEKNAKLTARIAELETALDTSRDAVRELQSVMSETRAITLQARVTGLKKALETLKANAIRLKCSDWHRLNHQWVIDICEAALTPEGE